MNLNISTLSGFAFLTPFKASEFITDAQSLTGFQRVARRIWDMGDGTIVADTSAVTHIYKAPGEYTIRYQCLDIDGNRYSFFNTVSVTCWVYDAVHYSRIPQFYSDPGQPSNVFTVQVTSTQVDRPIVVNLFATNSQSIPLEFVNDKWGPLSPRWRFIESEKDPELNDFKVISQLSSAGVPLTAVNADGTNCIYGLSAELNYRFIDDYSTNIPQEREPLILNATLQTSAFSYNKDSYIYKYDSFSNSKVTNAAVAWQINYLPPHSLKITSNYYEPIHHLKWNDIPIPFVITAHVNYSNRRNALYYTEGIAYEYPASNNTVDANAVNVVVLTSLDCNTFAPAQTSSYAITQKPVYKPQVFESDIIRFQQLDTQGVHTGGSTFANTTIHHNFKYIYTEPRIRRPFPNAKIRIYHGLSTKTPLIEVYRKFDDIQYPVLFGHEPIDDYDYFDLIYVADNHEKYTLEIYAEYTSDTFTKPTSSSVQRLIHNLNTLTPEVAVYDVSDLSRKTTKVKYNILDSNVIDIFNVDGGKDFSKYIAVITGRKAIKEFELPFKATSTLLEHNLDTITPIVKLYKSNANIPFIYIPIDKNNIEIFANNADDLEYSVVVKNENACIFTKLSASVDTFDKKALYYYNRHEFAYPSKFGPQPTAWIANNLSSKITKLQITPLNYTSYTELKTKLKKAIIGTISVHNIDSHKHPHSFNYQLSGESGVHSLAVDTSGAGVFANSLVAADAMHDCLYRFYVNETDGYETMLSKTLYLSSILPSYNPLTETATPACISLDEGSNIWVSLFNRYDILKLDVNFNLLLSATPQSTKFPPTSTFDGDFVLKPPVVETDQKNCVWTIYNNLKNSCLIKYDEYGKEIALHQIQGLYTATSIAVDYDNNIWVGVNGSDINDLGVISKYNTSYLLYLDEIGSVLDKIDTDFKCIAHVCVDRQSNLWFTHGVRNIGYYNVKTKMFKSWTLTHQGEFVIQDVLYVETLNNINEELGGISIDAFDRLWVIDSLTNISYCIHSYDDFLNKTTNYYTTSILLKPDTNVSHYITADNKIKEFYNVNNKSAKAHGDFTGNRWLQKYAKVSPVITLSGVSVPFEVRELDGYNEIRRKNESFSMVEYLQSLALPEFMQDYTEFYSSILAPIVGDDSYLKDNIGIKVYERIANFVDNTADIDTCNVTQLQSLANMTGVKCNVFANKIPTDIRRMIDIASVSHSSLFGTISTLIQNPTYDNVTAHSVITPGEPLVIVDKVNGAIIDTVAPTIPSLSSSTQQYYLSSFKASSINGLGFFEDYTELTRYFDVLRVSEKTKEYTRVNSVFDWSSAFNKIDPDATVYDWVGNVESVSSTNTNTLTGMYGNNNYVENIFNSVLTNYLFGSI